jgi:hypothetical protein
MDALLARHAIGLRLVTGRASNQAGSGTARTPSSFYARYGLCSSHRKRSINSGIQATCIFTVHRG